MSERKGFKPMLAALASTLGLFNDPLRLPSQAGRPPKKMQGKRKFEGRDKPYFTMGYRGFPRVPRILGTASAPTIDQVRNLERKYKTRLHVKMGLIYFKSDGVLFNADEAKQRMSCTA